MVRLSDHAQSLGSRGCVSGRAIWPGPVHHRDGACAKLVPSRGRARAGGRYRGEPFEAAGLGLIERDLLCCRDAVSGARTVLRTGVTPLEALQRVEASGEALAAHDSLSSGRVTRKRSKAS